MKTAIFETHLHTIMGSPCSILTPEEIVATYLKNGYTGVFITDHIHRTLFEPLNCSPHEKINRFLKGYRMVKKLGDKKGLKVFLGAEINISTVNNLSDFLLLGVDEDFLMEYYSLYEYKLDFIKALADEKGFALIHAHPFRYELQPTYPWLLHGVEIFNAHPEHDNHNDLAEYYASEHDVMTTGGSDAHRRWHMCRTGVSFEDDITTPRDFVNALKERRHTIYRAGETLKKLAQ